MVASATLVDDPITMHLTLGTETTMSAILHQRNYHHVGISINEARQLVDWLERIIKESQK